MRTTSVSSNGGTKEFVGHINPSILSSPDGANFKALKTFDHTYDPKRGESENLGMLSEHFVEGAVYTGQYPSSSEGKIRFLAVHNANGKYYFTPIFLPIEDFIEFISPVENSQSVQGGQVHNPLDEPITDDDSYFLTAQKEFHKLTKKEMGASLAILALVVLLFIPKK